METNLNQKLVDTVLKSIPSSVKPVIYLMDSLGLSRESAYRRLRREIPFSVEELALLSASLGFSFDDLMSGLKKDRAFFDFIPETSDSYSAFLLMLQRSFNFLEEFTNARVSEMIQAQNRILPISEVFHDQIFKFTYYKWVHQNSEISTNQTFSEMTIPPELIVWQKKLQVVIKKITNYTLIIDPNIFLSLIRNIEYYYQRNLINNQELILLRNELSDLIGLYEKFAKTGVFSPNAYVDLYLSPLCINANIGYSHYDNAYDALFWVFTANPIHINNPEMCAVQKKWLNSLKRQSTLITQSNEILQAEFFHTQYEYLAIHLKETDKVN